MTTLAIDFDGVIHRYSKGYQDGTIYDEPIEGAFAAITELMKSYMVVVLSTRNPQQILTWFLQQPAWTLPVKVVPAGTTFWQEFGVLGVTDYKLPAMLYIDDRALRFTNWKDVLNYVR